MHPTAVERISPPDLVIPLPSLRHLQFTKTSHNSDQDVLWHLACPTSCYVELTSAVHTTSPSDILPHDSTRFTLTPNHIATASYVRISLSSSSNPYNSLEVYTPNSMRKLLEVRVSAPQFETFLADTAQMLSPHRTVTTLVFDVAKLAVKDQRICIDMLLSGLPELRRLEFGRCDGRYDILPLLSEARAAGCLCPKLEHLAVFWRYEHGGLFTKAERPNRPHPPFCDVVADMLQRRKDSVRGSNPLESLSVHVLKEVASQRYYSDGKWDLETITDGLRARLGHLQLEDVHAVYTDG